MRTAQRLALALALLLAGGAPVGGEEPLSHAEWLAYLAHYVSPDGRVIDTGNGRISHSEGQGYGMLLAVVHDDRQSFEHIWAWTRDALRVRDDPLFAWRFEPGAGGGAGGVTDTNNATDGDLLIAWALLEAGRRFAEPAHVEEADLILDAVREKLVVDAGPGPVLLPGAEGFERDDGVVVNLSYWVFPALQAFADHDPEGPWQALVDTGFRLLDRARFGPDRLPPDWLLIDGEVRLPDGFDPVFGYNAIRIPLYLAWSGLPRARDLLEPFETYWASFDGEAPPPATLDLATARPGKDRLSRGGLAVAALARFGARNRVSARAMMPPLKPDDDYYSSTLLLLSKVALCKGREP
ncbi:MAG TPA: glycosyl hydrolase family 8 [Geminicoccaceae bacterium]